MKKTIFTLAVTFCLAGTMLTSCQSSADKVNAAQANLDAANQKVEVANQELNQALQDSIRQFRTASEENLNANEKSIAEFRVKISKEKPGSRARDEKRLVELEQQNITMRKELDEFNDVQRDKWDSFRMRFKNDMDNHARAMKDFWTGGN